jgi:AraC-like DNA-binding protein
MEIFAEKTTYHISGGEIRIYSAGELHCGNIGQKQYVEWFQISFLPEFFNVEGNKILMNLFLEREFGSKNVFVPQDHKEICELLYEIFNYREEDPLAAQFCQSAIIQVLCRANRAYQAGQRNYIEKKDALYQIIEVINEKYAQINSVQELSNLAHYSPAYVNRVFREGMKISPYQFLIGKKLNEAKKVLRNGASVAEACEYAGFNDYSNFITLFKRKFGITPKQYGKQ